MIAPALSEPPDRETVARDAWPILGVLTGCYLVSGLDRYIVNLLLQPMAISLGLSDVQISFLVGFAFTLFYSSIGLLAGGFVDRYNRKYIILIGISVWTIATVATGLAWSYLSLLAARMLVGAGEAALAPCAYSLIAEAFPRRKLSRPTTLFFLGGAIGPGVSLVVGALALRWADALNARHALGALHDQSWRFVLLIASAPGLVALLAVMLFVRDTRSTTPVKRDDLARGSLWRELAEKPSLYLGLLGGTAAIAVYINGIAAWWPTHALRSFGWSLKQGGLLFGIVLAISAAVGILASGSLGTALMRRRGDAGNGIALLLLALIGTPFFVAAPLVEMPAIQLMLVACGLSLAFAINALAPVGCQLAAPPQMRGRISALYVASTTIVGQGFGPAGVATLAKIPLVGRPIGLSGGFSIIGALCAFTMLMAYRAYWKSLRATRTAQLSDHEGQSSS